MVPERLERTAIYKSDWLNLFADRVRLPSGQVIEKYHQIEFPRDSVCVLAVNPKGEICFIRSRRYSTRRIEWELPAGAIEKNETPLAAGAREFKEETGCVLYGARCGHMYNPLVGVTDHQVHIVLGEVASCDKMYFRSDETESVHWLDIETVREMIRSNEITDGVSLMPLLYHLADLG